MVDDHAGGPASDRKNDEQANGGPDGTAEALASMESRLLGELSKQITGTVKRLMHGQAKVNAGSGVDMSQTVIIDGEELSVGELADGHRNRQIAEAMQQKREQLLLLEKRLQERGVLEPAVVAKALQDAELGQDGGAEFLDKFCKDHPSLVRTRMTNGMGGGGGGRAGSVQSSGPVDVVEMTPEQRQTYFDRLARGG